MTVAHQVLGRHLLPKPSLNGFKGLCFHYVSSICLYNSLLIIADLVWRPEYTAEELEAQLTRTFQVASDWKAVLLLDEADVYLRKRDGFHLERNRLVATFLRTLEYYDGIFFLTTNMLGDFDSAILVESNSKCSMTI